MNEENVKTIDILLLERKVNAFGCFYYMKKEVKIIFK